MVAADHFRRVEASRDQSARRGGSVRGGRAGFRGRRRRILHAPSVVLTVRHRPVGRPSRPEAAEGEDRGGEFRIQRIQATAGRFAHPPCRCGRTAPLGISCASPRRVPGKFPTERQHGGRRVEFCQSDGRRHTESPLAAALLYVECVLRSLRRRSGIDCCGRSTRLVAFGGDRHRRRKPASPPRGERQPCGFAADRPCGVMSSPPVCLLACGDELTPAGAIRGSVEVRVRSVAVGFPSRGDVDQAGTVVDESAVVGLDRRRADDINWVWPRWPPKISPPWTVHSLFQLTPKTCSVPARCNVTDCRAACLRGRKV